MDYVKATALALKLIQKNGTAISVQKLSATAADATKPWKGAGTPTVDQSVNTHGVFLPHASTQDLGVFGIDDEMMKRVEQVALVPGQATDLSTFHQLTRGGVAYKIDWFRALKPADITVLYAFGVKR